MITCDSRFPEIDILPNFVIGDEFIEESLWVVSTNRCRVIVEGGREKEAVDGNVGVSRIEDFIQDYSEEFTYRIERLVWRHAVHIFDPELV